MARRIWHRNERSRRLAMSQAKLSLRALARGGLGVTVWGQECYEDKCASSALHSCSQEGSALLGSLIRISH